MSEIYNRVRVMEFVERVRGLAPLGLLELIADLMTDGTVWRKTAWGKMSLWERQAVLFELADDAGRIVRASARALADRARREEPI
jgi:hypothetical protein